VNRAVFLDRDGVITRACVRDGKPYAPLSRAEVDLVPGVADALDRLHDAGLLLIVVTNQPDVARGRASRAEVEAIHAGLRAELPLDDIHVCYHDDVDACACRKPAPGMLYAAAVAHEIALSRSYLVGDRWRDIAAGRRAGCTTILVDGGHDEPVDVEPDARMPDLSRAAAWILANERP
jgi:D-glycero-D-manno-heptose 1,7-bisphosphate phosphatase